MFTASGGQPGGCITGTDEAIGEEATQKAGVDTWLQNHPLMVSFQAWVTGLGAGRGTAPNPFVVGTAAYQRFLDVLDGCSRTRSNAAVSSWRSATPHRATRSR